MSSKRLDKIWIRFSFSKIGFENLENMYNGFVPNVKTFIHSYMVLSMEKTIYA